ncbi:replication protein A 70 kDa DNA-binding subunit B-like isoform X1 [Curcuma longa]|uniref:replication protein A 70 kDa DNA-binding subunit B-like isoform X1 n=1 Tax=Curcuma longa TaxID=136217 RepID=UPI003D9E9BBB
MATVPIDKLTNDDQPWVATITVEEKLNLIQSMKSPTKFQKFIFSDTQGAKVEGIMFNRAIETMASKLQPYKKYRISNAQIREIKDPKYRPANVLMQWVIGVDTVIEEIDDDIIVLPIKYDFTPFQDLGQHVDKKDAVVDIIGIVVEAFPVKAVSTKHGPTNVQKFLLIDDSIHSIMLSISKDFLVNEGTILLNEVKKFPILIARRLRVSYFNGIELSTHFNSVLLVDPPIAEAMRLKNWVKRNRKMIQDYVIGKGTNQHTHNVTIPTDSNITLLANILPFQKVALIKAKINFKEIIQKYYYMACKKCFHATTAAYHYEYTCNFCNEKQLAEPRCRFEINLSDESGAITATLFGEMTEQILGLTATEAMKTPSKMHIDSVHSSLETKEYIIQIKPSKQKDKESQHKYSIVYCVEYKHVEKSSNLLTHPICESSGVLNSKEENLNIQEYATDVTLPLLSPGNITDIVVLYN